MREEVGLELGERACHLRLLGVWETPPYLVFPMTTYFFMIQVEATMKWQPPTQEHEVEKGEWIRPIDALERWSNGDELIAPPTQAVLRALAQGGIEDISQIFESDDARGMEPTYSYIHPDKLMIPTRTPTLHRPRIRIVYSGQERPTGC